MNTYIFDISYNFFYQIYSYICLYSLFENVALGLATDKASASMLAASISLHQPAESIALLVACLRANIPTNIVIKWLSMYSLVGPIGVMAGVFISRVASPLLESLIIALTAGTFLYVGATEVCMYSYICIFTFIRIIMYV